MRILLIMHSTRSDNLGVGALTVGQVEILREIASELGREIQITVLDWKDARKPYVVGADIQVKELDGRFLLDPRGFLAEARRADIVIDIGAGDSFADIYGSARLKRMFVMKLLTHLVGTPLIVAPQTIGPFTRSWSKRLALASLRWSALVSTRDSLSTKALHDLGYRGAIIEASDVAFRLPFERMVSQPDNPPRVGINISGLLMSSGYSGKNELGIILDYPELMRLIIGDFLEKRVEVHLVPHVIVMTGRMQREDDLRACQKLSEEFPEVICAPAFAAPSEAKSYISGMDFFIGARMHSCIAALSAGVPVVPMAYSRKFRGLFGSLGYAHTVDCTQQDAVAIRESIMSSWENRLALAVNAETARAEGLAKLKVYKSELRNVMREVND